MLFVCAVEERDTVPCILVRMDSSSEANDVRYEYKVGTHMGQEVKLTVRAEQDGMAT